MAKLNKWQAEIEQLEKRDDTNLSKELWTTYNSTLRQVRKELKRYLNKYEDLPYWQQVETKKLQRLEKEITDILNSAYPQTKMIVEEYKKDQLKKGYNGVFYHIENQENFPIDFGGLDTEFVRQSVQEPLAGKRLSERLYKQRDKVAKAAQNAITTGVVQGQGYAFISRIIQSHVEVTYRQALRIARTEGGRLRSLGKQKAYEEAEEKGVNLQKMWVATLDAMTRSSHQHLDGQVVDIKEKFRSLEGDYADGPRLFGIASEDINCRCTTVTVVNGIKPSLRKDNETGEIIDYQTYEEWEKAIDRRKILVDPNADYLKAHKMVSVEKGDKEVVSAEGIGFNARKVLNSNYDLYVSDGLGSGKKAFNYYERQIDTVLPMINLPEGAKQPRFVLANFPIDIGKAHALGSYDHKTNTVFINANKPNEKAIISKMKKANEKWNKLGNTGVFFAGENNPLTPLIHELGHTKHSAHIEAHAKKNGISYHESKERFNNKLLEYLGRKGYNIGEDISGYALLHIEDKSREIDSTNEIISEATVKSILEKDKRAQTIIKFLEKEEW